MIPTDYELGQRIIETCTCECGAGLSLVWGGSWGINSYVVKCTRDISHNLIARPARLGPYDIPGFNLFNLKGRRKQMEEELGKERATKLMKYEGVVSLTKGQAMEILATIWPNAPEVEMLKAGMICHQYGLNPLMKHVFLIPFKRRREGRVVGEDWVTVLGIKANRLIAHRRGDFSYVDDTPRVMTDEEQKRIFGEVDNSKMWAITWLKDGKGNVAPGYGSWPKDDAPYGADKGNTKANMAFIRSERNALDRLFAGEMPQGVEVIDEEYISGETIEGESIGELPKGGDETSGKPAEKAAAAPKPKAKTQPRKPESSATAEEEEGFKIDPTWLEESLTELKWTFDTCKTFLVSQYKVSPQGTLEDVIKRLARDQAEEFVKEIQNRVAEKQTELFT